MNISKLISRSCLLALISIQHFTYSFTSKHLPLPTSLANKSIKHLRVKQLANWSCGYNALYNACLIEQFIGLPNKHTKLKHFFNDTCFNYAYTHDQGPRGSSSNKTLKALALRLSLQELICLEIDTNYTIKPLGIKVRYTTSKADSPQVQEHKKQQAVKAKHDKYFNKLVQEFNNAPAPSCMHFICNIETATERHWVLVSVTKKSNGEKMLYICDNMNYPIIEQSQMKHYIEYLYNLFNLNNTTVTHKLPVPVHPVQLERYKRQRIASKKAQVSKLLKHY